MNFNPIISITLCMLTLYSCNLFSSNKILIVHSKLKKTLASYPLSVFSSPLKE